MTSIKYPDNVQSKISLLEAANGAGLFIGPIFGGVIYQFTSFCVPFFLFSGLFLAFIPLMKRQLGEELDRNDANEDKHKQIGYFTLLKHKRVLFAALSQFFNIMMFTIGQPIFGPRLTKTYKFTSSLVGVCFALPTIFYIITGLVVLPLVAKKFE